MNNSANIVYIGGAGLTVADGLPIAPGMYFSPPRSFMDQLKGGSADHRLYAIAGSSSDVRLLFVTP